MATAILGKGKPSSKTFREPDTTPNYTPSRGVKIVDYRLGLSLEPVARCYEGRATIRFAALPSFDGICRFDFEDAEILSVEDESGASLVFRHTGAVLEVEVGDVRCIHAKWRGGPPSAGLYFTGPIPNAPERPAMVWSQCQDEDGHHFFPCHDHPSVKHPWTIELDAPDGYRLLSNGTEARLWNENGREHGLFEQPEPMPAYLVTVVAALLDQVDADWRGRPVRYFAPKEGAPKPLNGRWAEHRT